jgi:hypothetical protein
MLYLFIRATNVFFFRKAITQMLFANEHLGGYGIGLIQSELPSFVKMLFSFKKLTINNWIRPAHMKMLQKQDNPVAINELTENQYVYLEDLMYLPISYKGMVVEQPIFKGIGNHSIKELEEICTQYCEYAHQQEVIKHNCMKHIVELKFNIKIK